MKDIQSIYILDMSGTPLFIYEAYTQNMNEAHHALFSNFIMGLQTFVTELGVEESKSIELGKSKVFSSLDSITQLRFVIKVSKDAEEKKIKRLLEQIKNTFFEKFPRTIELTTTSYKKLLQSFSQDLKYIIEPETNIQRFLKSI